MKAKYLTIFATLLTSTTCFSQDLPETEEASKQLNEITVVSQSTFRSEQGHLVLLPTRAQKKHAFNGYDLLSNLMIPGLSVNTSSGEVSAKFGSVTLYINGIKATSQEVKVLRPQDIQKVEYFDAPTGLYAGETAVINYVVRQPQTGGYGEITAEQNLGYLRGNYGFAGKIIANKKTAIQIFSGYGLTSVSADKKIGQANYDLAEGLLTEQFRALGGRSKSNKAYFQADITNSNDRRVLQYAINYDRNQSPISTSAMQTAYDGILNNSLTQQTLTTDLSHQGGGKMYAKFNLENSQALNFNLYAAFAQNKYSYKLSESADDNNERIIVNSSSEEKRWNMILSFGYTKSFSGGRSLSVKLHDLYKNTVSDHFSIADSRSKLWSNEEILFVQYDQPLGRQIRLTLIPGVSGLHYKVISRKQVNLISPRLQLRMTAQFPENQFLMISGSIGNSFPSISNYSTTEQEVNQFMNMRGNPDLDNTKMYMALGVYGYNTQNFGLQIMMQYMYGHDFTVNNFYREGPRIIQSWTSDADMSQFQSSASATYKPIKSLSLQLTAGYNLYAYSGYQNVKTHSPTLALNATYSISNVMLIAELNTPKKIMGGDLTRIKTPWIYSLAANYSIKNWKIEVGTHNPFTRHATYHFQSFNPIYNTDYKLISRNQSQSVYIKVAFNFDFGKKLQKSKLRRTETEIENALIKVNR